MHHIIPYPQLVEIVDFLALVDFFLLLFLLLRAKDIALRDHDEFQQRILEPFQYPAVVSHHFPRLHLPHGILRIKGADLLLLQILRQPLRPGPGTGKQQDAVTLFLITGQISHQCLKTVIIGRQTSCLDIKFPVRLEQRVFPVHHGKRHHPASGDSGRRLLRAVQDVHLPGQDIALFQTMHHALPKLQLHRRSMFLYPQRFLHKHTTAAPPRRSCGKIVDTVQKIRQRRIKIVHIAFQIHRAPGQSQLQQLFLQLPDLRLYPVGLLRLHLFSEAVGVSPALRLDLFQAASQFFIRQDQLRSRKDGDRFQLLNGTLA